MVWACVLENEQVFRLTLSFSLSSNFNFLCLSTPIYCSLPTSTLFYECEKLKITPEENWSFQLRTRKKKGVKWNFIFTTLRIGSSEEPKPSSKLPVLFFSVVFVVYRKWRSEWQNLSTFHVATLSASLDQLSTFAAPLLASK